MPRPSLRPSVAKNTGTGRRIGQARGSPFKAPRRTYYQGYKDGWSAAFEDVEAWAKYNTVLVDAEDPQERFVHTDDLVYHLRAGKG